MTVRVYVAENILQTGQTFCLSGSQSHYLVNVMRMSKGGRFRIFDGRNGEFEAEIIAVEHKIVHATVTTKISNFYLPPDIWLLFAPLKKDCTDIVVQKSTELGTRKIIPVITDRTGSEKIRTERFKAQSIEAAEQCRRVDIPEISETVKLPDLLRKWDATRTLFFLNEKGDGQNIADAMRNCSGPAAIIIGPEGGFSDTETENLKKSPFVKSVYLGRRILRAETAAIAALSCWQAINGDWKDEVFNR